MELRFLPRSNLKRGLCCITINPQVALNTAVKVENELKDKKLFDELKEVVKTVKIGFTDATGGALHRLKDTKPSINTVKESVQRVPDAMPVKNDDDCLPIQSTMRKRGAGVKYSISILAKEGIKLMQVKINNDDWNLLEILANMSGDEKNPITFDTACSMDAMKELRKTEKQKNRSLLKEDLKEYHLFYYSCHPRSKMRFEYLDQWDPDPLPTDDANDKKFHSAMNHHR